MDPMVIFTIGGIIGILSIAAFFVMIVFLVQWLKNLHNERKKTERTKTITAAIVWLLLSLFGAFLIYNGLDGVSNDYSKIFFNKSTSIKKINDLNSDLSEISISESKLFNDATDEMVNQQNSSNNIFRNYINNHSNKLNEIESRLNRVQTKINDFVNSDSYKKLSDKKISNTASLIKKYKGQLEDILEYMKSTTNNFDELNSDYENYSNEISSTIEDINFQLSN